MQIVYESQEEEQNLTSSILPEIKHKLFNNYEYCYFQCKKTKNLH